MNRLALLGAAVTVVSVAIAYFSAVGATAFIWPVGFAAGMILLWRGASEASRGPWVLALARTGIGWAFVDNAQDKFRSRWTADAGKPFAQILTGAVKRPPSYFFDPVYQGFLQNVVLPNVLTFAYLIVLGELLVGLSLSLGLLTRLGAVGGIWLNLNYMLMKGFTSHAGYPDKAFVMLELVALVGATGLAFGLDTQVRDYLPEPLARLLIGGRRRAEQRVQPVPRRAAA